MKSKVIQAILISLSIFGGAFEIYASLSGQPGL